MKLPELRTKFRNKYVIRIVAGVLVVAMVGTGVSVSQVQAAKNDTAVTGTEAAAEDTEEETAAEEDSGTEDALKEVLDSRITVNEKEIGKEETVYIIADSTGKEEQVIVSDHLINTEDKDTLEDASNLADITNVKGDETFTRNGNKLVWQADGNDIYYQGTATEKAPVTQKITYYLDGKEIAPEELAGQSGTVTIRFDYTNNETVKADINGKQEEICVPFVTISGMVLDDSFTNIEVSNGKVIADGTNNVVVGYTLPGLKESLGVEDEDFDAKVNIPDYFEVTADVTDFSLDMTMTVAMNATNFISAERDGDLSSVDELLDTLTDATSQLEDGSAALAEGVDTLQANLGDFKTGVNTLKDGIQAYTQGASTLADGIGTLKNGVTSLADGVPALVDGVGQLKAGSASALTGANALKDGTGSLRDGAAQLKAGVDQAVAQIGGMGAAMDGNKAAFQQAVLAQGGFSTYEEAANKLAELQGQQQSLVGALAAEAATPGTLAAMGTDVQTVTAQLSAVNEGISNLQTLLGTANGGALALDQVKESLNSADMQAQLSQLQAGAAQVADGAAQVADGAAALADGLGTLDGGLGTLNEKAGSLTAGVKQLSDGTNQLADGASALVNNNGALNDGAAQLSNGTDAIVEGVDKLDDGAHELADGIVTFNEEGIEKIVNSYTGDIGPLMDRIQAVLDAGADYQTYTDLAEGVNGSVKFIYKTAAVKAD